MKLSPLLLKDFYKVGHVFQYPKGTEYVYSNLTPRYSRVPWLSEVVVFGIQYFIDEYLVRRFDEDFFAKPKEEVIKHYARRMDYSLGANSVTTKHLEALHDLGFLPIKIKALPEGTVVPLRTPVLTIENTRPEFFWVTNFLETMLSNVVWHPMTSASIAHAYKKLLTKYAAQTSDTPEFVQFQGHDFSMRGQTSVESAVVSGAAHLTSFWGTDTISSIDFLEQYYGANAEIEMIGCSVPATEHSVMCMGGQETELETYRRLIEDVYPEGIVSIVSDTWDYWKVLTETLLLLREKIRARKGKLVIRPDSGCPIKILCGDPGASSLSPEFRGTVEVLWEIFGGHVNEKGYKVLHPSIGVIYGDSITYERCEEICKQLKAKGFASTNVVFGIGSYTYQYVTRDTLGFAVKATWGVIDGKSVNLIKTPKTDDGVKHSATGLLRVNEDLTLSQNVTKDEADGGMLKMVFFDGDAFGFESLSDIRARLDAQIIENHTEILGDL